MSKPASYRKGLAQFNYWNFPDINPLAIPEHLPIAPDALRQLLDEGTHRDLSDFYRERHESGDTGAIFAYVSKDAWALRAPWVAQQMVAWMGESTTESINNCHKLLDAYISNNGQNDRKELVKIIKRDQCIFKYIMQSRSEGVRLREYKDKSGGEQDGYFKKAADKFNISEETVADIYRAYKFKFDEMTGKSTRWGQDVLKGLKEMGMVPIDQEYVAPPKVFDTLEEFFRWLDNMIKRLEG